LGQSENGYSQFMSPVVYEMIEARVLTLVLQENLTTITAELHTAVFCMRKQADKYFLPLYIVRLEF